MTVCRYCFLLVTALLLLPARCLAEKITLPKALEVAESQHPLLQSGQASIEGAEAAILTSRAYPNPDATFVAGKQTGQGPGGPSNFVPLYVVSQPLELGALRPKRIQLAEQGRESSRFALTETRLGVFAQVRRTFFQALRRTSEIGIAQENLRLVEDLRNRIRVRVEVGEVGRLELIRAEAEVASARTLASSAQLQQVTAVAQFRAAVGGTLAEDLELAGALDPPASLPSLQDLRKQALDRHPTLAVARSEVRRAHARLDYEKALTRPQPAVRSEVDMSGPSYRVGLSIPLPVWNQRQGPIAEAAAGVRQLQSLARARQNEVIAALEGAYGRYAIASQQVLLFEQGLLGEAEAAVRAAETAYNLGERGILEVLDAQRVLRTVRLNFLNAQYDRQAALIDLDELRAVDLRSKQP